MSRRLRVGHGRHRHPHRRRRDGSRRSALSAQRGGREKPARRLWGGRFRRQAPPDVAGPGHPGWEPPWRPPRRGCQRPPSGPLRHRRVGTHSPLRKWRGGRRVVWWGEHADRRCAGLQAGRRWWAPGGGPAPVSSTRRWRWRGLAAMAVGGVGGKLTAMATVAVGEDGCGPSHGTPPLAWIPLSGTCRCHRGHRWYCALRSPSLAAPALGPYVHASQCPSRMPTSAPRRFCQPVPLTVWSKLPSQTAPHELPGYTVMQCTLRR